MAVLLAYGSPALGHLYPLGALLQELGERGHRIHLRTLAGEVHTMRGIGMHTEPVDPRIEAITGQDCLARNALEVLNATIDVLCRRAVIEVDDLRRSMAQVQPDAVIVDANCWGAMSTAEASGVPWLVFSPLHALPEVSRGAAIRPRSAAVARSGREYSRRIDAPFCQLSLRSPDNAPGKRRPRETRRANGQVGGWAHAPCPAAVGGRR